MDCLAAGQTAPRPNGAFRKTVAAFLVTCRGTIICIFDAPSLSGRSTLIQPPAFPGLDRQTSVYLQSKRANPPSISDFSALRKGRTLIFCGNFEPSSRFSIGAL